MKRKGSQLIFFFFLVLLASAAASAQDDLYIPIDPPRKGVYPKNIKETLKKYEIERNKKDHEEMLQNGEEAVKLSEEVEKSFDKNQKLTAKDFEKLERIEKLVKKIRKELGGDDEDPEDEKPSTIESAVKTLRKTTINLWEELKKTSRHTISAVAIQSSNSLISIVRLIKFWKN